MSASWQQNCNLNTVYVKTHLLYQGKLYECKAPLDSQVLLIYLFLLQYFTYNSAKPDRWTRKEGEQRKRNETEKEMIREDNEKQDKTKEEPGISVETKKKTS